MANVAMQYLGKFDVQTSYRCRKLLASSGSWSGEVQVKFKIKVRLGSGEGQMMVRWSGEGQVTVR